MGSTPGANIAGYSNDALRDDRGKNRRALRQGQGKLNTNSRLFGKQPVDPRRLAALAAMPEPRSKYIVAITPRSGSSYLCDVMTKMKLFGTPGEMLNPQFIPDILGRFPARTPDEYLRNVIRGRQTKNGLAGLKASWFQFALFVQNMADSAYLADFKFVYLTRRDLAAQAVSLYKATATSVFHTNIKHAPDAINRLETLDYDFNQIRNWHEHIVAQEKGWQDYFARNHIVPLCLTYEEIEADLIGVIKRVAVHVGVNPENVAMPKEVSAFSKVSDARNADWASRFSSELAAAAASEDASQRAA